MDHKFCLEPNYLVLSRSVAAQIMAKIAADSLVAVYLDATLKHAIWEEKLYRDMNSLV